MLLVQDGYYWLVFSKYKLNVEPAYGTVETNHKNSKAYIDGKNVRTAKGSDDEYTLNFGPYFPGTHIFQMTITTASFKV